MWRYSFIVFACFLGLSEAQTIEPFLRPPFRGEFHVSNVFDHNYPIPFTDTGEHQLTWWGDEIVMGYDGHSGYDWVMPEGTLLLSAAAGEVVFAGATTSFCKFESINRDVEGLSVVLKHEQSGRVLFTTYSHMSELFVQEGDLIPERYSIGLSGNTGCSRGPHLHFSVRLQMEDNSKIDIDPYGWKGHLPDPWERHEEGTKSHYLWLTEPLIYRESSLSGEFIGNPAVLISKVRYMGVNDKANPNNEFIELSINKAEAPNGYFLGNHQLSNDKGQSFILPDGIYIYPDQSIRVYSGQGRNSETRIYLQASNGIWDDSSGCVSLKTPEGKNVFRFSYRNADCP